MSSSKYLHHDFQNQIINLSANSILQSLLSYIHSSSFHSIVVDTSQEISKVDQLSIVFRYVTISEKSNSGNKLKRHESFLDCSEVSYHNSKNYEDKIFSTLVQLQGIDIKKCIEWWKGYNGASTMSGLYSDLKEESRLKLQIQNMCTVQLMVWIL